MSSKEASRGAAAFSRIGVAMLLLVGSTTALAQTMPKADRIWSGGPILTMDDKAMRAEAVAEAGGKIVAIGSRAAVMKTKGPKTQMIDLKGRTMVPGFVDAHGHIVAGGLQALSANLLAPPDGLVKDIPALQQTIRDWSAANADAVKQANIMIGFGYDQSQLKELRHPTRDDLDAISKDVPILIVHQSSHFGVLNSKGLELAGMTAASKDPAGGIIRRRAGSEEPDGVLEENAFYLAVGKILPRLGPESMKIFAQQGAKLWARFGYTTAQEGRSTPPVVAVMQQVADAGGFDVDVVTYPDVLGNQDFIKAGFSQTYKNRFRIGGGKLVLDGSPQGFTAWRDQPYYKPVGDYPAGYSGYPAVTAEQAMGAVQWAAENGIQLLAHAGGERASDMFIASLTAAQARFPAGRNTRPVLIHGHFQRPDQVESYQALGVFPSLFPMHTFYWGDWHLDHTVGPVAGMNINPVGWYRARGMMFSSHHDAPVAFPDSMRVLDATVTRRARGSGRIVGPEHRVDVITGLKAMTIWPAYQHFEEATKGSLEPGKLADFAILSKDPTKVEPTTIADIKVTETIKEGKTIFSLKASGIARAPADITPLLLAFAGEDPAHAPTAPTPGADTSDDRVHDAMFRMMAVMAGGEATR